MSEIRLPKGSWWYDQQDLLGPRGGFGEVFRGRRGDGEPVAVKRLRSDYPDDQQREMRIADFLLGHGLAHVIPILDAGFDVDAGTNFIVMPIAEGSLQQRIKKKMPVGEQEAIEILDSIAAGLEEIGDIIHRDLKPGNVLLHENVWKLADLGLARFVEAATSQNTMRDSLTPPYAAPEQWRGERPTKVTDVYALGCIMYALLRGAPPFEGPTSADFSHQHQFVAPPSLGTSPHLRRLAAACLSKSPELRPSIQSLRKQLRSARDAAKGPRGEGLADAAAAISEKALLKEQERLQREQKTRGRGKLAEEAVQLLEEIYKELETFVLREAPNATLGASQDPKLKFLSLGMARLEYGIPFPSIRSFPGHRLGSRTWDIVAGGYISVETNFSRGRGRFVSRRRQCRSANLWFGRLLESDDYRWWEVSYVYAVNHNAIKLHPEPFGIWETNYITDIGDTDYNRLGHDDGEHYWVAEDPRPVTPEFVDDFLDRWIEPLSQVAPGDDQVISRLFPERFLRKQVSSKFKVDQP
jgi:serine/threonine protein kinase